MCRSDSGADTRDSENTFPASLADERKKKEREEEKHMETERSRNKEKKKVKARDRKPSFNRNLFNSLPLSAFQLLLSA